MSASCIVHSQQTHLSLALELIVELISSVT